ncbi:hypothetical protein [Bradyrhizobium sp. CCBAU 53338]|uniref:hypothetical protein n=1 Tax=Bradyrhizobium sp. CCBAU 53338 TaxID=1325111 RepID=UPI00188CA85A|nr:hypothetical protein [Bradyrhizobium sp. CCBAU 53338]
MRQAELEHRKNDDSVFGLARSKPHSRDLLELGPVFMEIAESLLIGLERRCKSAKLARCAERERERDRSITV